MDSPEKMAELRERSARWREKQDPGAQRKPSFKTPSQVTVDQVYTPENTSEAKYLEDQGLPGEYPYLRGVHASGYRGRLWTMRMFAGFGLPLPRRVSLTEEGLDILQLAWSGEPFSYEGKRYTYRDVRVTPDPVQDGGPPLWIAATSEAGALRAARFDTNLLPQGPKAAVLEPWKEALAADGRDPGDKRGRHRTHQRALGAVAVAAAERYRRNVYIGIIKASADHKSTAAEHSARTGPRVPDPLNPLVWTAGDADHCVAELTDMIRDHDVTDLVGWGGPPGLPPSVMNASLERFANDVVPRIRENLAER